jgi:hypothetical protein
VDATSGVTVAQVFVRGIPEAIALSPRVLAVLTAQGGPHDRISWFSATDGTKLGSVTISPRAAAQLAANDRMIVYRVGRQLRSVSTHNRRNRKLVKTAQDAVGLSLAHGRLLWAENHGDTGRLRMLAVG